MSFTWTKLTCPRCQRHGFFDLYRTEAGFACGQCAPPVRAEPRVSYNPLDPLRGSPTGTSERAFPSVDAANRAAPQGSMLACPASEGA